MQTLNNAGAEYAAAQRKAEASGADPPPDPDRRPPAPEAGRTPEAGAGFLRVLLRALSAWNA